MKRALFWVVTLGAVGVGLLIGVVRLPMVALGLMDEEW